MARKESVLTQIEKESFEIERFIFHIIIQEDVNPEYLEELVLTPDQNAFFKARLIDVSEGIQHEFPDKENSGFYQDCVQIVDNPEKHFVEMSKKITSSFKTHHTKNTNDGVFITALVKVQDDRQLIFLLKMDNRKVYEYKINKSKALLTEITNTFVEDKKAIQKSALIDVSDHYSWDVLATDRSRSGNSALSVYFSKFLSVIEKETPSKLTEKAVILARQWAIDNKASIPLKYDVSHYKNKAIEYLSVAPKFKTKDFIEAIVVDEPESRKEKAYNSLKDRCDERGLTGQSFAPNKNVLDRRTKKNIRQTAEGVKIEWEGDPSESMLTIPNKPDKDDGLYHIVIKTENLKVIQ